MFCDRRCLCLCHCRPVSTVYCLLLPIRSFIAIGSSQCVQMPEQNVRRTPHALRFLPVSVPGGTFVFVPYVESYLWPSRLLFCLDALDRKPISSRAYQRQSNLKSTGSGFESSLFYFDWKISFLTFLGHILHWKGYNDPCTFILSKSLYQYIKYN